MKVQRIRDVKLPTRGTPLSAGLDFYVPNNVLFDDVGICLKPGDSVVIPSGIKVEVPKGYALIGFNKSGIAVKRHLYVGACVIDEDYQGEVHIHLTNVGKDVSYISPGDKIAQFVLVPVLYADIEEVDELHKVPTERGTGAFGSTDRTDTNTTFLWMVEDISKRKFKKGDKVRIKDGISSKTHHSVAPNFVVEMDYLIGKTMTVDKYTDWNSYVICNESGWCFHEDWLEPYEEQML